MSYDYMLTPISPAQVLSSFMAYAGPPLGFGLLVLAFWGCLVVFLTLLVVVLFACFENLAELKTAAGWLGNCGGVLLELGLFLGKTITFFSFVLNPHSIEFFLTFSLPGCVFGWLLIRKLFPRR